MLKGQLHIPFQMEKLRHKMHVMQLSGNVIKFSNWLLFEHYLTIAEPFCNQLVFSDLLELGLVIRSPFKGHCHFPLAQKQN